MPDLPPLRALVAFEAVGRCGGVAAAATELGVSPGAVSQQLQRLESDLGVALLRREGRGVALTSAGRDYHAEISQALLRIAAAGERLHRGFGDGGLRLSALTSVAVKWIGRRIFDWQEAHPEIAVHVAGTDSDPEDHYDRPDFRIYYGGGNHAPHHAELFRDWVVPACAPSLLRKGAPVSATEILRHPLLHIVWHRSFDAGPGWEAWARAAGCTPIPRAGLSFSLSSSAIDAAVAGRGFVLGQVSMIGEELASGRLVTPVDLRLPLPQVYYLGWTPEALDKPGGRAFHRWLMRQGREQGARSAPGAPAVPS